MSIVWYYEVWMKRYVTPTEAFMATITAIFEHGVFRPLEPVELPEHTRVEFEPKVATALPFALQDTDITDRDVETLLRVARDKHAPAGRYKRTPKKVSMSKQS